MQLVNTVLSLEKAKRENTSAWKYYPNAIKYTRSYLKMMSEVKEELTGVKEDSPDEWYRDIFYKYVGPEIVEFSSIHNTLRDSYRNVDNHINAIKKEIKQDKEYRQNRSTFSKVLDAVIVASTVQPISIGAMVAIESVTSTNSQLQNDDFIISTSSGIAVALALVSNFKKYNLDAKTFDRAIKAIENDTATDEQKQTIVSLRLNGGLKVLTLAKKIIDILSKDKNNGYSK